LVTFFHQTSQYFIMEFFPRWRLFTFSLFLLSVFHIIFIHLDQSATITQTTLSSCAFSTLRKSSHLIVFYPCCYFPFSFFLWLSYSLHSTTITKIKWEVCEVFHKTGNMWCRLLWTTETFTSSSNLYNYDIFFISYLGF
jgi:hypothetical protein